jgi:hypothetical protein
MTTPYHHTQRGTLTLAALLISAIVIAGIAFGIGRSPERWFLMAFAAGFVILAWLFSSLTVDVGEGELRWYFGPGMWRYRIALDEIEDVRVVRNGWWQGFGIRMRPGFRLYNVSGLDAVELRLRSGEIRRVGSDDAQQLATALKA